MSKNSPIKICNAIIHPGETLSLGLPLPELFSCAPLYMPVKVVHGKKPGPCLLLIAAMHGNEVNGTEIINRLLAVKHLSRLHGTIIAVPVMNVYGLLNRSRYLLQGMSLDCAFPGSKTGSYAARFAEVFVSEIFSHADYCIDLQTGLTNYTNLPQLYVNRDNPEANRLAMAFNAPVVSHVKVEAGSLRELAQKENKTLLVYEAGEAMRFDEHAIRIGLRGILSVMKTLQMLPEKLAQKEKQLKSFFANENVWVHAESSGVSHTKLQLGQLVHRGDELSVIKDPFGTSDNVIIKSPSDGIVVGKNNQPLVHEGEGLFKLAVFDEMEKTASHLEDWKAQSHAHLEKRV